MYLKETKSIPRWESNRDSCQFLLIGKRCVRHKHSDSQIHTQLGLTQSFRKIFFPIPSRYFIHPHRVTIKTNPHVRWALHYLFFSFFFLNSLTKVKLLFRDANCHYYGYKLVHILLPTITQFIRTSWRSFYVEPLRKFMFPSIFFHVILRAKTAFTLTNNRNHCVILFFFCF